MIRTVNLFPRADDANGGGDTGSCGFFSYVDVYPNGSPYGGSPTVPLWQAWRDDGDAAGGSMGAVCAGGGAVGDTTPCSYGVAVNPTVNCGADVIATCRFDPPPTLSIYNSVTIHVWWDYAGTGANNWKFPPDNAHGPQLRVAFKTRDGLSYNFGPTVTEAGYDGGTGSPVGNRYCNMNQPGCGAGYDGPIHLAETFVSHPEGGPWTQDDLINLSAGINAIVASPALDVAQAFPRLRIFHVHVELQVQDLGGYVKNVQHDASLILRMFRKARNVVNLQLPGDEGYVPLGNRRQISHVDGPSIDERGWEVQRLARRATQVVARSYFPESFQVNDECFDLRDYATNFWAAAMIDTAWTPELNGLAYLDLGGGYVYARPDQDAWSPRPGDGVHVRVIEDFPNLSFRGWSIAAADDVELSLQNSNLQGAGWGVVDAGGSVVTAPTYGNSLVDELGYLDALEVSYQTGTRAWERSLGLVSRSTGALLHLRAVARVVGAASPASNFIECVLRRNYLVAAVPVVEYWDAVGRAWSGSIVYNRVTDDLAFGELVSDAIPCDVTADADPEYHVKIGRSSSNAVGTFILGLVDVQLGGPANGRSYGARPALVSLGSTIARVEDVLYLKNDGAGKGWFTDRGVAVLEFSPQFRTDAMPGAETKPLLFAQHNTAGTGNYDRLDFVKGTGLRFRRHVDGSGDYDAVVNVATQLDRSHVVRAYARWLDADGWDGYGPRVMTVGFSVFDENGALLEQGQASADGYPGTVTLDGTAANQRVYVGHDLTYHLDGYVRMWDVKRNPLSHDEIIWRR